MPSGPGPSSPLPAGPRPIGSGSSDPGSRAVHPLDDDPLTSPSFPRIAAEDSRSYRRTRSDRGTGSHSIPAASESQPHARPSSGYPAVPPVTGLDARSASYSQPAVNGLDYAAAPAMPPVPAVDPYRQHSVSSASDSYPGRAAANPNYSASSDYPASVDYPASSDYASGSDYAGSTGSYSTPAVCRRRVPPAGGQFLPGRRLGDRGLLFAVGHLWWLPGPVAARSVAAEPGAARSVAAEPATAYLDAAEFAWLPRLVWLSGRS